MIRLALGLKSARLRRVSQPAGALEAIELPILSYRPAEGLQYPRGIAERLLHIENRILKRLTK